MRWLGVSGLAVGVFATLPDAEAAITVTDVNKTVGFTTGSLTSVQVSLRGSAKLSFSNRSTGGQQVYLWGNGATGVSRVSFRSQSAMAALGVSGKTMLQVGNASTAQAPVANKAGSIQLPGDYSHKYLMFKFDDTSGGATTKYGWMELSQNNMATTGPDVTIHRWAYDTTGAQIVAGAVPEPASAAAATGMALVMGAAGVRAWRKQRQTKA